MRFGRYIPQGVAVGIDADTEKALRAIRQMDDEIVKEMKKSVAFEMDTVSANASLNINKEQPLIIAILKILRFLILKNLHLIRSKNKQKNN